MSEIPLLVHEKNNLGGEIASDNVARVYILCAHELPLDGAAGGERADRGDELRMSDCGDQRAWIAPYIGW